MPLHDANSSDAIAAAAARWLVARDRGLSPAEQDAYLQWLRQDPAHAAALAREEATLRRLMQLGAWQPVHSAEPNPDLFAPARPRRGWRWTALGLSVAAAAAVLAFVALRHPGAAPAAAVAQKSYLRVNERQALPDGTVVELREGSRLTLAFSEAERRVQLEGEAHFAVTKNPRRPFVVEAGRVAVRAVGTAFDVRLDSAAVVVLVTEGSVRVESEASATPPPLVAAGQRATVSRVDNAQPSIESVTAEELSDALEWQAPRLQFVETPLAEVVAEFNRRNARQLVLGEPELAALPIGGRFRVDNVDGFVRLLELTLDIRAETRAQNQIVLTRSR